MKTVVAAIVMILIVCGLVASVLTTLKAVEDTKFLVNFLEGET